MLSLLLYLITIKFKLKILWIIFTLVNSFLDYSRQSVL